MQVDLTGVSDDAVLRAALEFGHVAGSLADCQQRARQWAGALPVAPAAGSTVTFQFRMQAPAVGYDRRWRCSLSPMTVTRPGRQLCRRLLGVGRAAASSR